eukprot:238026-Amphidinium_carterae.7
MVQSVEELRSLATKCAECKDAVAAVAPFRTSDGGLQGDAIHFRCERTIGTSTETEILPGFLYQLSMQRVVHSSTARVLEIADDTLPSIVLQALIPSSMMHDEEWGKIRAGDLRQFRQLVDSAMPVSCARALIDVFRLSRVGEKAAASLIRVRQDSVDSMLVSSGMHSPLFVNPLGDLREQFKVLWLSGEDAKTIEEVRELICAKWKDSSKGIVWKDGNFGVRFVPG